MVVSELDVEEVLLKRLFTENDVAPRKKETLSVFQFALVHLLFGTLISTGNGSVVPNRALLFYTYQKSQH